MIAYTPRISIIAALSENRVIGNGNKIPWHIKEDLIRLKNLTVGHVVIVGRTSYESMLSYYQKSGKPTLSLRTHLVVTSDADYVVDRDKGIAVHSIDEALQKAQEREEKEIFIIGGANIFQQTINLADRLYLTIVEGNSIGDTYFPEYAQFSKVISSEKHTSEEYTYSFVVLEREH